MKQKIEKILLNKVLQNYSIQLAIIMLASAAIVLLSSYFLYHHKGSEFAWVVWSIWSFSSITTVLSALLSLILDGCEGALKLVVDSWDQQ